MSEVDAKFQRPIIVVTGATSGVGYGICERLLSQLCSSTPPDINALQLDSTDTRTYTPLHNGLQFPCEALTLVLACIPLSDGEKTKERFLKSLDLRIQKMKRRKDYDGQAERFRENLCIEPIYCNLLDIKSIFRCTALIKQKFRYVSHLVLNAGINAVIGKDMLKFLKDYIQSPISAVTSPKYLIESYGEISPDGLGYVWQLNVFGHFVLYRALSQHMEVAPFPMSQVLWMSSLDAIAKEYDSRDWQLIKTVKPYEASKYEVDLLSATLDRIPRLGDEKQDGGPNLARIRHFTVHPGVVATQIGFRIEKSWIDRLFKLILFYLARYLGSPYHTINPFYAAIVATYLILVLQIILDIVVLRHYLGMEVRSSSAVPNPSPIKYSARKPRIWREHVTPERIDEWDSHEEEGRLLLDRFEGLYDEFHIKEGIFEDK
ncbi:hypothetical protein SISSUDRAFT_1017743 [Sistotremastrum suecicum HHB10207 ss-3]|uniref:NAD(P)-binding protein n=1 Tax=Sistotremastrum suecicum HHB10207 ss-3 TaxID=1314776 RepID=A0A166G2A7_9AGAM|nr:hypothetical protein SISSUDRAFT_1017743 [Sistotremastrum suecicum HHB10207 ss-3]